MKPYDIKFEHTPDYLYVFVSGDNDSYDISKAFWQEIFDYIEEHNVEKVIVHEDIIEIISLEEVYRLVDEFKGMGCTDTKIAFVDSHLDHYSLNMFGGIIAQNMDIYCSIFNNLERAKEWIRHDDPERTPRSGRDGGRDS